MKLVTRLNQNNEVSDHPLIYAAARAAELLCSLPLEAGSDLSKQQAVPLELSDHHLSAQPSIVTSFVITCVIRISRLFSRMSPSSNYPICSTPQSVLISYCIVNTVSVTKISHWMVLKEKIAVWPYTNSFNDRSGEMYRVTQKGRSILLEIILSGIVRLKSSQ
jgi:hypothetical protein